MSSARSPARAHARSHARTHARTHTRTHARTREERRRNYGRLYQHSRATFGKTAHCFVGLTWQRERLVVVVRSKLPKQTEDAVCSWWCCGFVWSGQTVENEHPAALWAWPERWAIEDQTPRDVYMAWKAAAHSREGGNASTVVIQQCAWNTTTCNTKCPLFT